MTRIDNALFIFPALLVALFRREQSGFLKTAFIMVLGFFPFVIWELFSLLYYGFPFPNTAYSKIGAAFPSNYYLGYGTEYYIDALLVDILLVLLPLGFAITACLKKSTSFRAVAVGVTLYMLYVFYIGGDFMSGRHFTAAFFISIFALALMSRHHFPWCSEPQHHSQKIIPRLLAGIFPFFFIFYLVQGFNGITYSPNIDLVLIRLRLKKSDFTYYPDVVNERLFYAILLKGDRHPPFLSEAVFFHDDRHKNLSFDLSPPPLSTDREKGAVIEFLGGVQQYYRKDRFYYANDVIGLGDPLLARLPGIPNVHWRIGHIHRKIPRGYLKSLATGTNCLKDPALREYLDILWEVTRSEELFTKSRIEKIIGLNTGRYKHLLDAYKPSEYDTPTRDFVLSSPKTSKTDSK